MLGVIDTISQKDFKLNTQVDFLFDGAEEFGLVGAYQYADYLNKNNLKENYDYLNLEAMGGEPPHGFVIKNTDGNYRVQKTLSKTRGSILLAMDFIYSTGIVTSTTDDVIFNDQNWTGGVNVFLGKASVYHTKYDKIAKEDHLKIAGCQLLDFVLNYEPEDDGYNGNSVGYGIAPFCIVLPSLFFYIVNPIIFIAIAVLIFFKERKNVKEFLFDLLFQFICFIIILAIFIIIGLLVYSINSNSASNDQTFVFLSAFMGLFLFLIFQRIFKIKKWSRFRLIFDLLLIMLFITTDLALPLLALTIISAIFYFFEYKIIKYISAFFQYLVMSLFFAFIIQLLLQYTPRLSPILGNIFVFTFFFIFSYHLSSSPLDLYDVSQEEKIIKLIKILFKKDSDRTISDTDTNSLKFNIIDEVLEDEEQKASISSSSSQKINIKNKFMNKKMIAVYLLFFYCLYFLIILLVLFFKPYPYSKSYTVTGIFFNIYSDYKNSMMVFMPYVGYNYAKKNIKETDYDFKEGNLSDYIKGSGHGEDKVLAVKSNEPINNNNPQCNFTMPNVSEFLTITYNNINNNKYEFIFQFNITHTACIDAIYLNINCEDCVEEMNGNKKKKENRRKNMLLIRFGKENITDANLPDFNVETKFILNVKKFSYYLFLNTKKNTKDYLKFLESFGEASVNFGQFLVSDTLYKYEEEYIPDN